MSTNRIGQRHAGDLGGRLSTISVGVTVLIAVADDFARFASVQHLVWMLVNLLSRQPQEVRRIDLKFPSDIETIARLSPLVEDGPFFARVLEAAGRINPSLDEAHDDDFSGETIFVRVGPGDLDKSRFSIAVSCDDWSGYAGTCPVSVITDSANPIGPYVAACLGAGEIFKFAREVKPEHGSFTESVWLNAFSLAVSETVTPSPRLCVPREFPTTALAGVGAVGCSFLHLLYAMPDLAINIDAIDGDPEGVTVTNLNRYALFDTRHIGCLHPKASTAAGLFADGTTKLTPYDISWQEWRAADRPVPEFIISAVDGNIARHAIQDSMPITILGAATNDLKLQVNYFDVRDPVSACLKCRNPIEAQLLADDVIIDDLKALADDELAGAAKDMGVDRDDLRTFLSDPKKNCGLISGTSLQKFATASDTGRWSVGFVSVLAGVILAAEFLKQVARANERMTLTRNMFRFQFWHPDSDAVNRLTSAQPEKSCICRTPYYQAAVGALGSVCG